MLVCFGTLFPSWHGVRLLAVLEVVWEWWRDGRHSKGQYEGKKEQALHVPLHTCEMTSVRSKTAGIDTQTKIQLADAKSNLGRRKV